MQQRRVDLVLSLDNEMTLHIEFQSANDRYTRIGWSKYWPLINWPQIKRMSKRMSTRMFKLPLRQVVLYVGQARASGVSKTSGEAWLGLAFQVDITEPALVGAED